MTTPAPVPSKFGTIAATFARNVQALRVFANTIALHADAHDAKAFEAFTSAMRSIVPSLADATELPEVSAATDAVEPEPAVGASPTSEAEHLPARLQKVFQEAFKVPAAQKRFFGALKAMSKAAPIQGAILRASALITLMSHVEALVADLVHLYYALFPSALPGDERSITLADLRSLGSVSEAEKLLVSKEVDSLLRESLEKQLDYFAKRPKVNLKPLAPFVAALIEIDQRRNLLVHNRGIVNRIYLERVDAGLISGFRLKEGDEARISAAYLSEALDLVEVCGTILSQLCWRKWQREEARAADTALTHHAVYEALAESRHQVVTKLAAFALETGMTEDSISRAVCINKAIAHRALGENEAGAAALAAFDWSASSLRYRIALHAVKGEDAECFELIPKAVAAGEVDRSELDEWPVFAEMRNQPRWAAEIPPLFPEEHGEAV